MAQETLLRLESLTVGYGERTVLRELSLEIPARGVFGVLGPAGVGKSTLLRTLSRWNEALPAFWRRGSASLGGRDLFADLEVEEVRRSLALLVQKSRLYTASVVENLLDGLSLAGLPAPGERRRRVREVLAALRLWDEYEPHLEAPVVSLSIGMQRRLAVARLVAGAPKALLLDEPFRDLAPGDRERMVALLRRVSRSRAVVVTTHHQGLAKRVTERVALLAGGRLVEAEPTRNFFLAPRTDLAQQFVRSGNCWPRKPERDGSELRAPSTAVARYPSEFHWVLPGLLGGCQQPGLLQDTDQELAGLRRLGCEVLVSLRERPPDEEALRRHGFEPVHLPVPDMGAPSTEQAMDLCGRVSEWLESGRTTVLHCKAGLGRTGTLLAAFLIYRGSSAVGAVEKVRSIHPRYIQSDAQMAFLEEFEALRRGTAGFAVGP